MKLRVCNDLHIGVQRSAGTTTLSAWNLRQMVLKRFERLMSQALGADTMILGDLFDSPVVPMGDWLSTFRILRNWLLTSNHTLYLVGGNHDISKTDSVLSSFQLLCKVLAELHPENLVAILEPRATPHGYVICHLANQDLFDQALSTVPSSTSTVFAHCNFDNNFATQSDQSLNLSQEQADACPAKHIVIAHEHQTRKIGKVWIPGNQIVTSVSDCLGSDAKRWTIVEAGQPRFEKLYDIQEVFEQMPWDALTESDKPFIRVSGQASAAQAPDVVSAISTYRRQSNALVITNAVKITAEDGSQVFERSLESVKAFDVMAALKEFLKPEEFAVVEGVL